MQTIKPKDQSAFDLHCTNVIHSNASKLNFTDHLHLYAIDHPEKVAAKRMSPRVYITKSACLILLIVKSDFLYS